MNCVITLPELGSYMRDVNDNIVLSKIKFNIVQCTVSQNSSSFFWLNTLEVGHLISFYKMNLILNVHIYTSIDKGKRARLFCSSFIFTHSRGVEVPVPQDSVPKEREPAWISRLRRTKTFNWFHIHLTSTSRMSN